MPVHVTRVTADNFASVVRPGARVRFRIPVRGGQDLGFGDVIRVNRRTVTVEDMKNGQGRMAVDKALVFESIEFVE